ncbi:hypothetical protein BN948_01788 [Hydrogenophaga intermedia]|uniref:Uncharacterized protein n=1 Tax=Hydrogenophaga intermedia TaxID=65786 RepID=A0A1L1PMV0_HYDIT|nr:hypothetical protein BN948_01788 [Hydrogenophaga intermedia]
MKCQGHINQMIRRISAQGLIALPSRSNLESQCSRGWCASNLLGRRVFMSGMLSFPPSKFFVWNFRGTPMFASRHAHKRTMPMEKSQ